MREAEKAANAEKRVRMELQNARNTWRDQRTNVERAGTTMRQVRAVQRAYTADMKNANAVAQKYSGWFGKIRASMAGVKLEAPKVSAATRKMADDFNLASNRAKLLATQQNKAGRHAANMTAQFNDIGVMLASGQSPLLLAVQQGTQVTQVFDMMRAQGSTASAAIREGLKNLINPFNLATIGAIALGAAVVQWGIEAIKTASGTKDLEKALEELEKDVDDVTTALGYMGDAAERNTPLMRALLEASAPEKYEKSWTRMKKGIADVVGEITNFEKQMAAKQYRISAPFFAGPGDYRVLKEMLSVIEDMGHEYDSIGESAAEQYDFLEKLYAAMIDAYEFSGDISDKEKERLETVKKYMKSLDQVDIAQQSLNEHLEEEEETHREISKQKKAMLSIANSQLETSLKEFNLIAKRMDAEKELKKALDAQSKSLEDRLILAQLEVQYGHDSVEVQRELEEIEWRRIENKMRLDGASEAEIAAYRQQLETVREWESRSEIAKQSANNVTKAMTTAKGTVVDFGKVWADWLLEGEFTFSSFAKSMKRQFRQLLVELINMALKNKLIFGIGIGGGGAAAGAAAAGGLSALGVGAGGAAAGMGLLGSWGSSAALGAGGTLTMAGTGLLGGLHAATTGGIGGIFSVGANAAAAGGGIGATIGAAIPVLGAVAAAVSFFSSKTKELDRDLKITTNTMGSTVDVIKEMQKKKFWGLSKKRWEDTSAADPALSGAIAEQLAATRAQLVAAANILGLNAAGVEGFSGSSRFSIKGLSESEAQAKIEEELVRLANQMAYAAQPVQSFSDYFTDFANEFEDFDPSLLEDIHRGFSEFSGVFGEWGRVLPHVTSQAKYGAEELLALASSLQGVNAVFEAMGRSGLEGLAGAEHAQALVGLFGDIDTFVSASDAYYQAFYTEAERMETLRKRLSEALTSVIPELGGELPKTLVAYRELVNAQDLTTESGRQLYATLLNVAPQFASIIEYEQSLLNVRGDAVNSQEEFMEQMQAVH